MRARKQTVPTPTAPAGAACRMLAANDAAVAAVLEAVGVCPADDDPVLGGLDALANDIALARLSLETLPNYGDARICQLEDALARFEARAKVIRALHLGNLGSVTLGDVSRARAS